VVALEADVAQLQAMGFSRAAATEALAEADNDLAAALELMCG
jgi:NACalpha-BTF3-like transcription factor